MSKIDRLQDRLEKLKANASLSAILPKTSGWLSRKLLTMLAVAAALIWLGRDNLSLVINGVVLLAVVYLITQAVNDAVHSVCDAWVRRAIVQGMAADGINEAERNALLGDGAKTEKSPITG